MKLTPAEVYAIANARAEVRLLEIQRLAWMTASLSGFAKVEPFEKCFPKVVAKTPKASSASLFAYFDGVKAEREAKKA